MAPRLHPACHYLAKRPLLCFSLRVHDQLILLAMLGIVQLRHINLSSGDLAETQSTTNFHVLCSLQIRRKNNTHGAVSGEGTPWRS